MIGIFKKRQDVSMCRVTRSEHTWFLEGISMGQQLTDTTTTTVITITQV